MEKTMEWLKVTTHMAPMMIQAGLLNLVWTRPYYRHDPMIRWIRISLLPISLSLLLSDLWNLKYNSQLSTFVKTNMGCTWGGHFFRAVLLAFQQPPSPDQKSTPKAPSDEKHSPIPFPLNIFLLAFAGSTNPSKQPTILSGRHQDMRADMIFLWITLRRLILLNLMSVAGLMCWKITNDERIVVDQPIINQIRNFKLEIRSICFGIFVWIGIDLSGCIPRLTMFILKMTSRLPTLHSKPTNSDSTISNKLVQFNQIDLGQNYPLYFKRLPLSASSITDFWSRHWHEVLKDLFIEAGLTPVNCLLVHFLGFQAKSKIVRISGIMGAFAVSAVLHEIGFWTAGPLDITFRTTIFFLSQGVGVSLENGYKKAFNRNVNGCLGRVWLITWLVYFGQPMVSMWVKNLGLDENKLFRKVDETGFYRLVFSPLIVAQLLVG